MAGYDTLPSGVSAEVKRITVEFPDEKIKQMKTLIEYSPIGPETYENQMQDRAFGINRDWLIEAKRMWLEDFDWKEQEAYINQFPHYTAKVADEEDDGTEHTIHFTALFSQNPDAVPIAFFHGWPGSFLEFYAVLTDFAARYSPATLPYHLVVPSLPGYALSSGPPLHRDWSVLDSTRVLHAFLTRALGFRAYVTQGGDVGASIARILATTRAECRGVHLNIDVSGPPPAAAEWDSLDAWGQACVPRMQEFRKSGLGYAIEQGTRPATIGLALSASPLALLAWVGEKYLAWSDEDPATVEILRAASLYWLSGTFSRSIYPYKAFAERMQAAASSSPSSSASTSTTKDDPSEEEKSAPPPPGTARIPKPLGFSAFPKEIVVVPKAWLEKSAEELLFYRAHERGGHFAALECPVEFAKDVEVFLRRLGERGFLK